MPRKTLSRTRCNVCLVGTFEVRKAYRHGPGVVFLGRAFHWLFVVHLVVAGVWLAAGLIATLQAEPSPVAAALTTPGLTAPAELERPGLFSPEQAAKAGTFMTRVVTPMVFILLLSLVPWALSAAFAGKRESLVCNRCSTVLDAA